VNTHTQGGYKTSAEQLHTSLTRESTRRVQVPPPRQSYSPGGVTIFALQSDLESRIPAGSHPKLNHW